MDADVRSIAQMAQHLQHPTESDDDAGPINERKRKADDDGQTQQHQQRARRNRYVSIACNECKRRKIKCNGQTPCQRCGNLNLECVYAPNCCPGFKESQEFKDMSGHIVMLQEQVNALYEGLNSLRAQIDRNTSLQLQPTPASQQSPQHQQQQPPPPQHTSIDPSLQSAPYPADPAAYSTMQPSIETAPHSTSPQSSRPRSSPHGQQISFRGPTSSAFNIGVAKHSLQTMGITGYSEEDGNGGIGTGTAEASPERSPPRRNAQLLQTMHRSKDPIWSISQDEALRLCQLYGDEMGVLYPVTDLEKLVEYTKKLYRFMDAARRSGLMQQGLPGADAIDDEDTNILKVVLAMAMTVEAAGPSDLGQRLFECVQPAIDNLLLGKVGIKGIRLLTLTAMYEFHRDNESTSWRIIGLTARLCIELGLHRRETYEAMQDENERSATQLLFWAIYNLDRRWSFGTGMPFALQDSDIDPQLPKPGDRSPYLSAMIQYSGISSKVWRSVTAAQASNGNATIINVEEMNYLDYQVIQWHRAIPAHLRFEHPSQAATGLTAPGPPSSRGEHRLRVLLYLRGNQMRTHLYSPVLHSVTTILQYRDQAQTAVDVAKDSVRVLTHINHISDIYRTQQSLFNAFLTSALAVLFLAVSHAPAIFAENVREEFYMALDLVRGFSKGSWVSKRLWKTIRVLKEVGPKLGLPIKDPTASQPGHIPANNDDMDPSRSAAVAMAGLAGHNVDESALYNGNMQHWSAGGNGVNTSPEGMANDLTSLFEAAGGCQMVGTNGGQASQEGIYGATPNLDNITEGFGDDGLTSILKELF